MNKPLIEACVDSYQSCVNAWKGGADRLELCAHLAIGGCTPSPFVFRQVMEDCDHIKANILIRPRFGDFLYTEKEMELMCDEIRMFRLLGANGVVIGALTPDGDLDMEKMKRMMDCAGGMDVTLHRAFDMTRDPMETLEKAIELGCKTILTSGQQSDVVAGKDLLKDVYAAAAGRIDIMAGCGVKKWNIQEVHDHTAVSYTHLDVYKRQAFWNNEEFNQLLDDALKMTDDAQIAEAYAKAQAIAWEECPWIFLGNDNTINAYKTYVTGLQYKPGGTMVFRTVGLDHE